MNKIPNQTNKNSDAKTLILIFFCISFLVLITYWRMRDFGEDLAEIEMPKFEIPELEIPEIEIPEIEIPGLEIPQEDKKQELEIPQEDKKQELIEFVSPDQRLKLKYPANWVKKEKMLKYGNEATLEGIESLLFVQGIDLRKFFSISLIVLKLDLQKEATFENVIEKIKEDFRKRGLEMETTKLEEIDQEKAQLKIRHRYGRRVVPSSRIKIVLDGDKAYLVILLALDNHWPPFEKQAEKILDSVQLL